MSDTTELVQCLPRPELLGPALAALQWAHLAAWLLELHEGATGPRISLARATLATDLRPDARAITVELETLDGHRAVWLSTDGPEGRRVVALDAVRRALHACLDCLDGDDGERDAGVRETITLTLRAWRLYAGDVSPTVAGVVDGAAKALAPLVVLAATPSRDGDVFNGGPLP